MREIRRDILMRSIALIQVATTLCCSSWGWSGEELSLGSFEKKKGPGIQKVFDKEKLTISFWSPNVTLSNPPGDKTSDGKG